MKLAVQIFLLLAFGLSASAQTRPASVLIDEFQNGNCEEIWARLDMLAVQMNNDPSATGTVSISGVVNDVRDNLYYEAMVVGYFADRRMSDRVNIIRTALQQKRHFELWLTPANSEPPVVHPAEWPLEYPENAKPFIFTERENYMVTVSVCLPVDELALLAKVLGVNPKARTNVVLKVPSHKEFALRKRKVIKILTTNYSIPRSQIRIFEQLGFKKDPHGIESNTEYWLVP